MSRARAGGPPAGGNPPPVANATASGLDAIRSHGDRDEELYISSDVGVFEESFMTDRILTSEESVRMVKKIELLVRQSREYKAYISYLRADLGMSRCSFIPNADCSGEVGLEFHHCPLTLYDIVDLVLTHRMARGQAVTSMTVADEVLGAHMQNMVGLVPLLASIHKLVHAGHLVVHPAMIHGQWLELLRAYPQGVTEDMVERLSRFCCITESDMQQGLTRIRADGPPRLREGAAVPAREEIEILLLSRGGA
jgi:hypothetical protein